MTQELKTSTPHITRKFGVIWQLTQQAFIHWDYAQKFFRFVREKMPRSNSHARFLTDTYDAHKNWGILCLMRLYDRSRDNFNLTEFLRVIKKEIINELDILTDINELGGCYLIYDKAEPNPVDLQKRSFWPCNAYIVTEKNKLYFYSYTSGSVQAISTSEDLIKRYWPKPEQKKEDINLTYAEIVNLEKITHLESISKKQKEHERIISNLKKNRNKFFAHIDINAFGITDLSIGRVVEVSENELQALLDKAKSVVNKYKVKVPNADKFHDFIAPSHTEEILKILEPRCFELTKENKKYKKIVEEGKKIKL